MLNGSHDGEQRAQDLAEGMAPGKNNDLTLVGRGERGAQALGVLSD